MTEGKVESPGCFHGASRRRKGVESFKKKVTTRCDTHSRVAMEFSFTGITLTLTTFVTFTCYVLLYQQKYIFISVYNAIHAEKLKNIYGDVYSEVYKVNIRASYMKLREFLGSD